MKKINLMAISLLGLSLALAGATQAATFEDNSLVRGEDGQIFVIKQGERVKVSSLDDLRRNFRGKEIMNVDNQTLAGIALRTDNSGPGSVNSGNSGPSANSGRGNANNRLIRAEDGKIFEVVQGERRQIRSLDDLRRNFRNRAIVNVDDNGLRRFPVTLEDHPNALFDNNRLLRDARNRVFVVEDNGLRRIADLNELRREHLGQAIHNVNDDLLSANGVKLRGDGTVDDNSTTRQIRGIDDFVNGVKLRGDGTVDDNGVDDNVGGIDLRGDGTPEDNTPGGVDLRGDGTVEDNSASSGGDRSSGGSSSGGGSGGSGGNSTDD